MRLDTYVYRSLALVLILIGTAAASSRPRRNDESMFLNDEMRDLFRPFLLSDTDLAQDRVTPWPGQDSLPKFRRVCPSSLFMRYNPNRIPAITFEKHCTQQQCSALPDNPGASETTQLYLEDPHNLTPMCRPIAYYRWVKVLTRRADGRRKTRRRLLEIPVGCSCSADAQKA
ncbi:hypothetical protein ElyMa_000389600 [Elysia marginata]|uniref:Spaetzle domain-containing protein n=1 Tax=Elysia marginata TaxID=1093978 RepID=A0AAV4FHQ9_9GAST|nr:hypothetical protein ElyMa_000389600 [Elysia marginata]